MKKSNYLELPVRQFLARYPQFMDLLPFPVFSDPRYVVRFIPNSDLIEVGFPGDNWSIK